MELSRHRNRAVLPVFGLPLVGLLHVNHPVLSVEPFRSGHYALDVAKPCVDRTVQREPQLHVHAGIDKPLSVGQRKVVVADPFGVPGDLYFVGRVALEQMAFVIAAPGEEGLNLVEVRRRGGDLHMAGFIVKPVLKRLHGDLFHRSAGRPADVESPASQDVAVVPSPVWTAEETIEIKVTLNFSLNQMARGRALGIRCPYAVLLGG